MTVPLLTFEPLTESHAAELYPEFRDQESFRFTAGSAPQSLEALRQEFAGLRAGPGSGTHETWLNWVVREPATGNLVGALQATIFNDGALWIGYRICRSAAGRGVATAAVHWLLGELSSRYPGMAALAAVDTRNEASLRVLKKCGFALLRTEPAQLRGVPTTDHVFHYIL